MRGRPFGALALAATMAMAGCGAKGGSSARQGQPPPPPPPQVAAPIVVGSFAFYGTDQGLSPSVHDVSADEGGNVYVAAGDALYAKARADRDFRKFTPAAAGLTQNCHDPSEIDVPDPPDPPVTCPIIAVAGAAAGMAVIGLQGVGTDYDYDAPWALASGGADLVSFDGKALTRTRHVYLASPPGVVCEQWQPNTNNTVCAATYADSVWMSGRRKMRQVKRIVVNHDPSRPLSYGDVYFGATHGTLGILVASPDARGWIDSTKGDPAWAATKGVWEHYHPAKTWPDGRFLTGESTGLAFDPVGHVPWFSNQFFTVSLPDYDSTPHPSANAWWGPMSPPDFLAFWQPEGNPDDASLRDNVSGLSFCDDGTLWVASSNHGIGRYDPASGVFTAIDLPNGYGNAASAIACDPADGSIWVGFAWGGFGRYRSGSWDPSGYVPPNAPQLAWNPVPSIQIDRWATPRVVYFAHQPSAKYGPGGVTVYTGP
ncbi:MAG TPA: hypothetical protein VFG59_15620 [Anaeromyxobacter sp.]|nr:hypothetical protein [Anaeromyxobacter sp.]